LLEPFAIAHAEGLPQLAKKGQTVLSSSECKCLNISFTFPILASYTVGHMSAHVPGTATRAGVPVLKRFSDYKAYKYDYNVGNMFLNFIHSLLTKIYLFEESMETVKITWFV
jgi:hypothetical protein